MGFMIAKYLILLYLLVVVTDSVSGKKPKPKDEDMVDDPDVDHTENLATSRPGSKKKINSKQTTDVKQQPAAPPNPMDHSTRGPIAGEEEEEKKRKDMRFWKKGKQVIGEHAEFETAGVIVIEAACEVTICMDVIVLKKGDELPDLFVVVDYGEYDENGKHVRIGSMGKTEVIMNKKIAHYNREEIRYSKSEETHDFRVRENGYYNIQLFDKELILYEYVGHVIINVTDVGPHTNVKAGFGRLTFEIFAGTLVEPEVLFPVTTTTTAAPEEEATAKLEEEVVEEE